MEKLKIYTKKQIGLASGLGGPFIGGYLIAQNYKVFGELSNARKAYIYSFLCHILLLIVVNIIPMPTYRYIIFSFSLCYSLSYGYTKRYQDKKIEAFINNNGMLHPTSRSVWIGIIGGVLFSVMILLVVMPTSEMLGYKNVQPHNTKISPEVEYNPTNIDARDIIKIEDALECNNFYKEHILNKYYANKEGNEITITIICDSTVPSDSSAVEPYIQVKNALRSKFPSRKINIDLAVDKATNVVKRL